MTIKTTIHDIELQRIFNSLSDRVYVLAVKPSDPSEIKCLSHRYCSFFLHFIMAMFYSNPSNSIIIGLVLQPVLMVVLSQI